MYDLDGTPVLSAQNPDVIAKTMVKLEKQAGLTPLNFEFHYHCKYTEGGLKSVNNYIAKINKNIDLLLKWVRSTNIDRNTAYCAKQVLKQHQVARRDAALKQQHITNYLAHMQLDYLDDFPEEAELT